MEKGLCADNSKAGKAAVVVDPDLGFQNDSKIESGDVPGYRSEGRKKYRSLDFNM